MTARIDTYDELATDLLFGFGLFDEQPEPPARPLGLAVYEHLRNVAAPTPAAARSRIHVEPVASCTAPGGEEPSSASSSGVVPPERTSSRTPGPACGS